MASWWNVAAMLLRPHRPAVSMKKIMDKSQPNNLHIGNQGEHIVASELSRYCVVREVGQGKDTGIDLYCEIVNKKQWSYRSIFSAKLKQVKAFLFLVLRNQIIFIGPINRCLYS